MIYAIDDIIMASFHRRKTQLGELTAIDSRRKELATAERARPGWQGIQPAAGGASPGSAGFTPPCCRDRRVAPIGTGLHMSPHTATRRGSRLLLCTAPRDNTARKWLSLKRSFTPTKITRHMASWPPRCRRFR
ncbi:uncharacterized protein LOC134531533 [Bacillus rossius redtenbacheri]|uniref:uncharacterized protein LOC134531533 n=1 Tax=Bacillus rossius redtenbacheri TaxID=93214 RepID=UPI002FDDF4BF